MKKIVFALMIAIFCAFIFGACDKEENNSMDNNTDNGVQENSVIESFDGEWIGYEEGEDKYNHDMEYSATVRDGTILIFDRNELTPSGNLWWYGTCTNPSSPVEKFEFVSDGLDWIHDGWRLHMTGGSKAFIYEKSRLSAFLYHDDAKNRDFFVIFEKVENR